MRGPTKTNGTRYRTGDICKESGALFYDTDVIVHSTMLQSATNERLDAERAALRRFRDCTIADFAAWRSRDAYGQG